MKNFIFALLASFGVFSSVVYADDPAPPTPPAAPAQTHSDLYLSLETDSELRMLDQLRFNSKLNNQLKIDKNYKRVEALLLNLFNHPKIIKTVSLGAHDTRSVNIVAMGIDKPTEIILTDSAAPQTKEVLYTNFQEGKGIAAEIVNVLPSQHGRYLAILLSIDGSIDQLQVVIYSLPKHKVVSTDTFIPESAEFSWINNSEYLFNEISDADGNGFQVINVDAGHGEALPFQLSYILDDIQDGMLSITAEGVGLQIYDKTSGKMLPIDGGDSYSTLAGSNKNSFFVFDRGTNGMGQLRQISRSLPKGQPEGQTDEPTKATSNFIIPESSKFLEKVSGISSTMMVAVFRNGAQKTDVIYDLSGKMIGKIPTLNCCSVTNAKWTVIGKILDVTLQSQVVDSKHFKFNFETQKWNIDPEKVMMTSQNLEVITKIEMVSSEDGTQIPVRLTMRANLAPESKAPVLISSYGGFNLPYIDPSFSPIQVEFIKRGGILVSPALRGGDELGPDWHKAAMMKDKIKTFQDLASVAKWLVDQKWTTPNLIASTGASNGGLTVSATALLYPDRFGLIIPVAGVADLLGKDRLDSTSAGWSSEYGGVARNADFLKTISPVELAGNQKNLKFLIIDGSDDTRVNPVHSLKLARALEDFGGSPNHLQLLSLRDAGHFMTSVSYQNAIGLKSNAVIWTGLFEQYGW